MKFAVIIGAALVAALLMAGPAASQGKDPFRPPAGAGSSGTTAGGGGASEGGQAVVPPEPQTGGGLPRTGLDYSLPILASLALIAATSMRLTSRALSP